MKIVNTLSIPYKHSKVSPVLTFAQFQIIKLELSLYLQGTDLQATTCAANQKHDLFHKHFLRIFTKQYTALFAL